MMINVLPVHREGDPEKSGKKFDHGMRADDPEQDFSRADRVECRGEGDRDERRDGKFDHLDGDVKRAESEGCPIQNFAQAFRDRAERDQNGGQDRSFFRSFRDRVASGGKRNQNRHGKNRQHDGCVISFYKVPVFPEADNRMKKQNEKV